MRTGRWTVVVVVSIYSLILPAGVSSANGGAFIELRGGSLIVAGQPGVLRSTVYVSQRQRDLLSQGPFYALLTTSGAEVVEGRPLPPGTIRLGTFTVTPERRDGFQLTAGFTAPHVASGYYSVWLCNDPCQVAGFRDRLSGSIRIAATAEEGKLLTQRDQLQDTIRGLRREIRRSDESALAFETRLEFAETRLASVNEELQQVQRSGEAQARELTADLERANDRARAWIWVASSLGVVLLIVTAFLWWHRRRRAQASALSVPDTLEELDELPV